MADAVTGGAGDDGFMQRFQLLVWPDVGPRWEEIDRVADSRAERCVEEILDRLLRLSPDDPFRARRLSVEPLVDAEEASQLFERAWVVVDTQVDGDV